MNPPKYPHFNLPLRPRVVVFPQRLWRQFGWNNSTSDAPPPVEPPPTPPPPPPPTGQSLTLTADDNGILGTPGTASVTNTGTQSQSWALTASAGLIPNPSTGTTSPGATTPISLTYTATGTLTLTLTNNSGGAVVGNPQVIAVGAVGALTLNAPVAGIVGQSGSASVQNTGGAAQDWALSATDGLTPSPASGTTAAGATSNVGLSYVTEGTKSLTLTNLSGGPVSGSPRIITLVPPSGGDDNDSLVDFYIDFETGNDSNSGLSSGNAWKHCPGDPAAAGNAASYLPRAGDRFRFKGGVVYHGAVVISRSGTAINPIIYDGNNDGSWGDGRAVIDGDYVSPRRLFNVAANTKFGIIRGFQLQHAGGNADDDPILLGDCRLNTGITTALAKWGCGIGLDNGQTNNWLVDNCLFVRIGQWRNHQAVWGGNALKGIGVWIKNCADITVRDCFFTKVDFGVSIQATTTTTRVIVEGSSFTDHVGWCVQVAAAATGCTFDDIEIRRCAFYDYNQYDNGNWLGCTKAGDNRHTNAIFIRRAQYSSYWYRIKVHSNDFYTDNWGNVTANADGGTCYLHNSQGPAMDVWNNVFYNYKGEQVMKAAWDNLTYTFQLVRVFNNTFINSPYASFGGENEPAKKHTIWKNNIFYKAFGDSNDLMINRGSSNETSLPLDQDYNCYFNPNWTAEQMRFAGPGYKTLAALQAHGLEVHSIYADPLFANMAPALYRDKNFRLQAGSPCRGIGANLSEFGLTTTDKDGNPRPAFGPWCIGAFEYQG